MGIWESNYPTQNYNFVSGGDGPNGRTEQTDFFLNKKKSRLDVRDGKKKKNTEN